MRSWGSRWLGGVVALVMCAACTSAASPPGVASPSSVSVDGGAGASMQLRPCPKHPRNRCGRINVPLHRDFPEDGTISIRFQIIARSDPGATPDDPIVAFEGGPGYGSIASAGGYRFLFGPLLRTRDLILMDQRGTGGSGAIDCRRLQRGIGEYSSAAAECARALGDAANAYGTAAAADDLASILDALEVSRVDVYGDSYGTYIAQVFAIRHPERTGAVVLDGAFDDSFDPFARDAAASLQRSWATLCRRAGTCPGIVGDIARMIRRLERRPLVGTGIDADGARQRVRLTAPAFAQLLYDATYAFTIYRDIPAALEAFARGDPTPLLRLAAEDLVSTDAGNDPSAYSEGAYMAISCHDYPTAWDRAAGVGERRGQLAEAIEQLPEDAFAPFPAHAWLDSLYEYQLVYGCIGWPPLASGDVPMPTDAPHPDVPVLVLNGEFDITTPSANARAAAEAWPNGTFVEVANEIHTTALYDYERCASELVRRFIRAKDPGDTSCASATPEVHVVEAFPRRVAEAPQAMRGGVTDRSTVADRQMAWVAAETVGDALSRWWNTLGGSVGVGLRGGSYRVRGPYLSFARPLTLDLRGVRFVEDLAVSGRVVWYPRRAALSATLLVEGSGMSGRLRIESPTDRFGSGTAIRGLVDGRRVDLTMPQLWST